MRPVWQEWIQFSHTNILPTLVAFSSLWYSYSLGTIAMESEEHACTHVSYAELVNNNNNVFANIYTAKFPAPSLIRM